MVIGDSVRVHPSCNLLWLGVRGCVDDAEVSSRAMYVQTGAELFGYLERHGKRLSRRVKKAGTRENFYARGLRAREPSRRRGKIVRALCVSACRVYGGLSFVGTLILAMWCCALDSESSLP